MRGGIARDYNWGLAQFELALLWAERGRWERNAPREIYGHPYSARMREENDASCGELSCVEVDLE